MKYILKYKWLVIAAWAAIIAVLMMIAPNMETLVREKGQINVPDGYSSTLAGKILNDSQKDTGTRHETQVALVFHSDNKLTERDFAEAEKAVNKLEAEKAELGITEIMSHFKETSLKDQLVSKDGKTILVSVKVDLKGREAGDVTEFLYNALDGVKLDHYYTSSWMIGDDLVTNSQEGLKKTESITVVFILAVLLIVFRSLMAPVIPLIAVGVSYLASQSIVAILVDKADFPLSTFTQIFLVAVLFGIGTDYCILLMSRFKEEMQRHDNASDAVIATYRTAGKTVFFSALAVMIGFASIGFSEFVLYQSAAAVAVGVAVLMLALVTVVPFFMALFGRKLFWPAKGTLEHKDSKLWAFAGRFALARPLIALLIVMVVSLPFLFTYDGKLSFNSLEEIGDGFHSIKAFNIIADGFGPGESMPAQVVIKNDEPMDKAEYLAVTEKMSEELAKVKNVKTVRSVTRPTGEPIDELYVSNQAKTLGEGIGKGNDGIKQISGGLSDAEKQLAASGPKLKQTTDGISKLISGTNELKSGIGTVQSNLAKIEDGIRQGAAGSEQIRTGLADVKANSEMILENQKKLLAGYKDAAAGLGELEKGYLGVAGGLEQLKGRLATAANAMEELEKNPAAVGALTDPNYRVVKENVLYSLGMMTDPNQGLQVSLAKLNGGLAKVQNGVGTANSGLAELITGQEKLVAGMGQLIGGISKQQAGLAQLANGQGQIVANLPRVSSGLAGINDGQQQLLTGFEQLDAQMGELTDGLGKSADGLNEVAKGLEQAQDYLGEVSKEAQNGFYIPEEVLASGEFDSALDAYMSPDRKVMTMDVVFKVNPYSNEAIDSIKPIEQAIKRVVKDTGLENADIAIGGVSSMHNDLDAISGQDYSRTVLFMLSGIFLILLLLFRSVIMPIYLIGSLILTYYTAMAISESIFVNVLGYSGISWAVPFFGFVILVALGIDYSIFLMDRFHEFKTMRVEDAILEAMKKMGTVIISAAVILGGTFAAMMPSGVLSLLQIATILMIGLVLYALFILPLFVPVMVKTFGQANWWPFKRDRDAAVFESGGATLSK
ncbi:MMPL family transporter [Neobacillus notoginsengisoli]|uniref:MMPL family transporter n=1 Tax=Neobacillus notoginsengisoli TaxID=1578198 RepID=A0A417YRX8_9BACI|nr:MMPL family transporter [Neobacillus notoginsengisoli]RHW38046.1 MMPL family transporter [Neobacillus notoginsengisoli]